MTSTTLSYQRLWDPRLGQLPDPLSDGELYARGDHIDAALNAPTVAIVGCRSCTDYGAHTTGSIAGDLAASGVTIVSGLGRGIDTHAHRGALTIGGRTVAVLGCGIDQDHPAANASLARQITRNGGIVSEYPPGVPPAPGRYQSQSRIIAALADIVLIVEAHRGSGALTTVNLALELGRPIYAIPGEITSTLSHTTNQLIRQGHATLASSARELLQDLGLNTPYRRPLTRMSCREPQPRSGLLSRRQP